MRESFPDVLSTAFESRQGVGVGAASALSTDR